MRHHFAVPAKENGYLTSRDQLKRKKNEERLPGTKTVKIGRAAHNARTSDTKITSQNAIGSFSIDDGNCNDDATN